MILLDTNAVIYYLQNDPQVVGLVDELRKKDSAIAVATLTEMEALSFAGLSPANLVLISQWLSELTSINLDSTIARLAARIRRTSGIKTPDAIIAATALLYNASLVTRDKEMKKVSDLKIIWC